MKRNISSKLTLKKNSQSTHPEFLSSLTNHQACGIWVSLWYHFAEPQKVSCFTISTNLRRSFTDRKFTPRFTVLMFFSISIDLHDLPQPRESQPLTKLSSRKFQSPALSLTYVNDCHMRFRLHMHVLTRPSRFSSSRTSRLARRLAFSAC